MLSNGIFDMSVFENMRTHELIGWLLDTAGKQEKDPIFIDDRPQWVAGPPEFRGHASALSQKADAAKNKDVLLMKEFEQERASTLISINHNAAFVVMIAHHKQDEGILHGKGYDVKEEKAKKPRGAAPPISTVPLKLAARRGDKAGSAVLTIERDPGAGLYEVQFCNGKPTGEESWQHLGNYRKVRNFVDDLQRASWYYFRVRSHGDNEVSPWSAPVDLIIG